MLSAKEVSISKRKEHLTVQVRLPVMAGIVALQTCSCLHFASAAGAQGLTDASSPPTWWTALRKQDTRITACRVTWKSTRRIHPVPQAQVDPEKWSARVLDWARRQGFSEAEAKRQAEGERRDAERTIKGRTIVSLVDFVRVGTSVRSTTATLEPKHRLVEFYDGTNALRMYTQTNGVDVPQDANLTRDPREAFGSGGKWQTPRFLLGLPLDQQWSPYAPTFSSKDATVRRSAGGDWVLERKVAPESGWPGLRFTALLRLTISKDHLRPTSYEVFNLDYPGKGGRSEGRINVEGYSQHRDGIWFPSKVTATTSVYSMEYTLTQAAFNEDVDPMEIRLPADTSVADARFGYGPKLAIYKLKNGVIPTDDEVRKMLNLDKEATQAHDKASKEATSSKTEQSSSPIAPAAGLMFIAMGSMMWVRSRKGETDSADQK